MDTKDEAARKEDSTDKDPSTSHSPDSSAPEFINLNEHKAGLAGLDKEHINKIIQENSKGSNFYIHQQKRQKRIDGKVQLLLDKLSLISEEELRSSFTAKADSVIDELESQRLLNRIIVHFDMDMFFAAVEIKYNPSLADKPVAVGTMSMISTSNYVARKFGVRSAMAGFIGKKLCPDLVLIKHTRGLYSSESKFIMNILSEYDPNLSSISLDEVYLDLTDYVFTQYSIEKSVDIEHLHKLKELPEVLWNYAFEIVNQIRTRILEESKLTISAGIACNNLLAKVCTDINKPNGQFMVKGYHDEIMAFVSNTEVRKFSGVGPVRGQILTGLGIHTGKDIFNKRATICAVFSENDAHYYMRLSLGIGYSFLDNEDSAQKSHSRETTMGAVSKFDELCDLLKGLAHRVSKDLKQQSQQGKTITIKLKRTTFEVSLKSKSIHTFTDDAETILKIAKDLLSIEMRKFPSASYRLIGVKVSNLKDTEESSVPASQPTLSQFLKNAASKKTSLPTAKVTNASPLYKCRLCEETFEDASESDFHKLSCVGDLDEILFEDESFSELVDEMEPTEFDENFTHIEPKLDQEEKMSENENKTEHERSMNSGVLQNEEQILLTCPVCNFTTIFDDNVHFNRHIDTCLNKNLVIELTQIPPANPTLPLTTSIVAASPRVASTKSKRVSPKSSDTKSKRIKANSTPKSTNKDQMRIEQFFTKK